MGSNSHWRISFSQANPVIYNTAFTLLNKAVHSPANPVKFLTDFEKALMQAMHRCQFPNSNNSQGLLLQLCPDNLEKEFKQLVFNCTGRLLGQHCPSCVLGETCLGTWVLYQRREERALAVMKQYLQQGMCSS